MKNMMLPADVKKIIERLESKNFEAYAVGGCVRDTLLGRRPIDWDITTSAMPHQVKKIFHRTVDTGIEHGTVTVLLNKQAYEVTTFRVDGDYEDHRHPKEVSFTRSLKEDLLRRDFTINAMAFHPANGLIDPFGGMADLNNQIIRCVGDAKLRLEEDALRILRAIRFAAQLSFEIEESTATQMKRLCAQLAYVSAERIQTEFVKMITSPNPGILKKAWELGITNVIFPEFDKIMETGQETPHHFCSVGEHTIKAMEAIRQDKVLRLTMFFHDMGKPDKKTMDQNGVAHFKGHADVSERICLEALKRLKFDNDTLRKVKKLVKFHDYRMPSDAASVRLAMSKIGREMFPLYMEVRWADTLAQSTYLQEKKISNLREIEQTYKDILEKKQCVSIGELAVSGEDLIRNGMRQGPDLGKTLDEMLKWVIMHPEDNRKEILLEKFCQ